MAKQDAARLKEIEDVQEEIRKAVEQIDKNTKKKQETREGTPA